MELTQAPPAAAEEGGRPFAPYIAPPPPPPAPETAAPRRLTSLDVFRGVTMLFMASEIMGIAWVTRKMTGSGFARFLSFTLDHVPWTGFVPWDLIQPSFMFMVG